jgi:hypothetical protein
MKPEVGKIDRWRTGISGPSINRAWVPLVMLDVTLPGVIGVQVRVRVHKTTGKVVGVKIQGVPMCRGSDRELVSLSVKGREGHNVLVLRKAR